MSKVYLSFLGTNDYLPCTYYRENFQSENVRFVQEATLRLCCSDWKTDDRVLIFTTDEARKKNWEDNGQLDRKTGNPRQIKGLSSCIQALDLSTSIERIDIPQGKSESEIWDIFSKIFDLLGEGDHVVFDITHAFRSIPMLAVVVLNYAKVMKGVLLDGIYYGAFEVLGSIPEASKMPPVERRAPILDLTPFDQLMDWTTAIDRFTGAGDGRSIHKLAMQNIRPIMKQTQGQDQLAGPIKGMANALVAFTNALATCRGPEISEIGVRLKSRVGKCQEIGLIRPLQPLFARIGDQTKPFVGNMISDGIQAVKWCLKHNLVQQGVTILRELVFSYSVVSIGADPHDVQMRDMASQALTIVTRKIADYEDQWHAPARDNKETARKLIEVFKRSPQLVKSADALGQLRNDMNHAGFGPQTKKIKDTKDFPNGLESAIINIEACLAEAR
jgi:CRISPR-associated Csx2 family protein